MQPGRRWISARNAALPLEFQRQLDLPRGGQRGSNQARAGRYGAGRREGGDHRPTEVCVIECVEELRTELEPGALVNLEILKQRGVELQQTGRRQDVSAGV